MASLIEPAGNASAVFSAALQLADVAMNSLALLTTLFASVLSLVSASPKYCKPLPGSTDWPSPDTWQQLNETVDGQLVSPPPPGAVCHPTHELFNNASCSELLENWTLSSWHAQNPITSDYNDDTCRPDPNADCSRDGYPAYTVNATKHEHVAAAVTFAKDTGVRLVIKGTGHDFPGRSAGRGSLSIHTHYLRGIQVLHNDPTALKYGGVAAVKIAAGMQMRDLYEAVAKENVTVVGGADLDVGIGGWTGGGGHSPISSLYGLGADNVLEMEVVTADGKIQTINEDCEPDLFWAMRGGGASTYAVMLSVTMRAHPPTYLSSYSFNFNTTASSPTFWNMTAAFHTHLPALADAGAMGYYWTIPNATLLFADATSAPPGVDTTSIPPSQAGLLAGIFLFRASLNITAITQPLETSLAALSLPSPIHVSSSTTPPADFNLFWPTMTPERVGSTNVRLGSWLLGRTALSKPIPDIAASLAGAGAGTPLPQLGHLVAGPGVHTALDAPGIPGGGNAVLPAWRKAFAHVVLLAAWAGDADEFATTAQLRDVRVAALRGLEPGSGAYVNEADPTETEWKREFWGTNYARLLGVKEKWDPTGVFWCRACVGSDLWEVSGEGDGVGQGVGGLCRRG